MKFSSVEAVRWESGSLRRYEFSSPATPMDIDLPPSENERFHLDSYRRCGTAGWLAVAIDIPLALTADDVVTAVSALIRRHDILRCHFTVADDNYRRLQVPPGEVQCAATELAHDLDHGPTFSQQVAHEIETTCSPLRPLSHHVLGIHRNCSTTIILGFDHCYVDAYSLAIIAREVAEAFDDSDHPDGVETVFLDHRRAEEAAPTPGDGDARLRQWGEFLAATNWEVPSFPIDLGLAPGDKAPMRTDLHTLLDAEGASLFRKAIHGRGIRTFPALLTAAASAVHSVGGPTRLPVVLPVRTRYGHHHLEAIGWMVGNAPILVQTDDDVIGACHANTAALDAAIPLADLGLSCVYGAFGDRITAPRDDVFMVSYVDYNKLPIPSHVVATHISGSRRTDTAQWWFTSDESGIGVRVRYPDTGVAAAVMREVTEEMFAGVATLTVTEPATGSDQNRK